MWFKGYRQSHYIFTSDLTNDTWEIVKNSPLYDFFEPETISHVSQIKLPSVNSMDLLSIIKYHEAAKALKDDLDVYGFENDIDMTKNGAYVALLHYIDATSEVYTGAKQAVDSYVDSLANLYQFKFAERTLQWDATTEDVEVLKEYASLLDEIINYVDEGPYTSNVRHTLLDRYAELFPEVVKYSKAWQEYKGIDDMAESTTSTVDAVNRLTTALNAATKAKQDFDAAMSVSPENEGFENYQSAYAAYAEEMEAGRVNSRRAMAAAEYLMAGTNGVDFDKMYAEGGYAAVNAYMKKSPFATVYGDKDLTYGEGYLKWLEQIADKNGNIVDSNGKVVASYRKVNGQIELNIEDLWGLADASQMSIGQVWDSLQAVGVYGGVETQAIDDFTKSLLNLGKAAGVVKNEEGQIAVDYEQLHRYAMDNLGFVESDWDSMKEWLNLANEIGVIQLNNVPDAEEGWLAYPDAMAQAVEATEHSAEDLTRITQTV